MNVGKSKKEDSITSQLLSAVEEYQNSGGTPYVAQMWRYALAYQDDGACEVMQSNRCDAIPYLPVNPSDYGLSLTESSSILDVGCLGGYGLYDIAKRLDLDDHPIPKMVGVDIDTETVALAKRLTAIWATDLDVSFGISTAEELSSKLGTFDVVISRLVLPYTDVCAALKVMSGLLSKNGIMILQVHAPRYYLSQARCVFPKIAKVVYYLKPVLAWMVFGITGKQPKCHYLQETALSAALLEKLCGQYDLKLLKTCGFSTKPTFVYGFKND